MSAKQFSPVAFGVRSLPEQGTAKWDGERTHGDVDSVPASSVPWTMIFLRRCNSPEQVTTGESETETKQVSVVQQTPIIYLTGYRTR
jgi:hypothetical protein